MKTKGNLPKVALSAVMVLLLCFPKLSLEGARRGLLLWYQTVLPTLLPFMVCTNLITAMNGVKFLAAPAVPVFGRLLGLSENGCFVLISGVLCGYPLGAKACSDFLDQGLISLPEARSLYAVSSFPSPMFLAGFVMAKARQAAGQALFLPLWKVAASLYLPLFPMFVLAGRLYGFSGIRNICSSRNFGSASPKACFPLDQALMDSIHLMVKIGGYLMIFSILAQYLQAFFPPGLFSVLLIAAAEMTTGIDAAARFLPGASGIFPILWAAAFGGFSGVFQVKSVTKNVGLSIRHYILWKLLHSLMACFFLMLFLYQ